MPTEANIVPYKKQYFRIGLDVKYNQSATPCRHSERSEESRYYHPIWRGIAHRL